MKLLVSMPKFFLITVVHGLTAQYKKHVDRILITIFGQNGT